MPDTEPPAYEIAGGSINPILGGLKTYWYDFS
jgi:hypothetical protein